MKTKNVGKIVLSIGAGLFVLSWFKKPNATVTTSESFDFSAYGGPTGYPQPIKTVANAIAHAEGFFQTGSVPARAHNPGDLKIAGMPTLPGTEITMFDSDEAGWDALYHQLWIIVTGESNSFDLDMTIQTFANKWTTTQQGAWASNVSMFLGASPSTPLSEVLI